MIRFETLAGARPRGMAARTVSTPPSGVGLRELTTPGGPRVLAPEPPPAPAWRSDVRPGFFFDLACPFSYILADRVERRLGDVDWVPVSADALSDEESDPGEMIYEAADLALAARLPLVPPERFPAAVPGAMRAAAYAAEHGAGARFALAASRLAFCGGFDLERRSVLADAAVAARLPVDEVVAAASEEWRDAELLATASHLRSAGMTHLPVVSVGGRLFQGVQALRQAVCWRRSA